MNKNIAPKFGEENGMSTLTNAQVMQIRKTKGKSQRELATFFNTTQATIWRIQNNKTRQAK